MYGVEEYVTVESFQFPNGFSHMYGMAIRKVYNNFQFPNGFSLKQAKQH